MFFSRPPPPKQMFSKMTTPVIIITKIYGDYKFAVSKKSDNPEV